MRLQRRTMLLLLLAAMTFGLLLLGVWSEAAYVNARAGAAKAYGSPTTMAAPDVGRYNILMSVGFLGAGVCAVVLFVGLMSSAAQRGDARGARGFDVIQ